MTQPASGEAGTGTPDLQDALKVLSQLRSQAEIAQTIETQAIPRPPHLRSTCFEPIRSVSAWPELHGHTASLRCQPFQFNLT